MTASTEAGTKLVSAAFWGLPRKLASHVRWLKLVLAAEYAPIQSGPLLSAFQNFDIAMLVN